jgi:hypothetical protein
MKKIYFLFSAIIIFISSTSAQAPINNLYTINSDHQNSVKTITNGETISGTPFLIEEWKKGILLLENGDKYDSYLLKYDVYNQTIFALNGKETIEIDQKIKEFILIIAQEKQIKFINASVFNVKQKNFYELVIESDKCLLLKLNKKIAESNSEKFTNLTESKEFKTESEYFIFDKELKKMTPYKKANTKFKSLFEIKQ